MWSISWTNFPSPHSLVHGQRWCVQFWSACLWSGECQMSWSCCISWSAIEYGRCMAGAPPTHHLLCLSLPSGQTLHGYCATPHQTIELWVLALVHECVIIILCKDNLIFCGGGAARLYSLLDIKMKAALIAATVLTLVCSLHIKPALWGSWTYLWFYFPMSRPALESRSTSLWAPLKVDSLGQCTYCVCVGEGGYWCKLWPWVTINS